MDIAGMVRRIDELGRVVIPKEIRRTLRIREGEEMTVSLMDEDTVVLKKFSPLKVYEEKARDYREIIARVVDREVYVTDKDTIIASNQKSLLGKKTSKDVESIIVARKPQVITASIIDQGAEHGYLVLPIILRGDALGAVIVESDDTLDNRSMTFLQASIDLIILSIE